MRTYFIFLMLTLLSTSVFCDTYKDTALDFSAIKTKYLEVDVDIENAISLYNYKENDEFTYKTATFSNYSSQIANVEEYYLDDFGNKVFAEIIKENNNSYAVFKVKPITKNEYVFYITGTIVSENKIILQDVDSILEEITEEKEYQDPTKYIKSNASEIITLANYLKTTDDALENLISVTNWVQNYLEYDMEYADVINDSVKTLNEKKGVCDEFSIFEAAILRAQGYPVKYVVGYANTSQEWGPHAWLEVFVPGHGWLSVDPTYNEVGFVDSSHIVLEKLKDPVESKGSVTATSNMDITIYDKKFEFKNKEAISYEDKGYKDVLKMKLIFSKDNLKSSPFILKLVLQNTTPNPLPILISNQTTVKQLYPSKNNIYYLKPFEEKTIDYFFKLPEETTSYSYPFTFLSQFEDVTEYINVYPNKGIYQELFLVTPPVLDFHTDAFKFTQNIFNFTNSEKKLIYDFEYDSAFLKEEISIPKLSEKKYTYSFEIKDNAAFNYLITGDYSLSGNAFFYETQNLVEEVNLTTVNQENQDTNQYVELFEEIESKRIDVKANVNYLVVVLIVVFVLFIIFLFISKSIDKKAQ